MRNNTEFDDWRKASFSNGQGACVEVAAWRKASCSNGQGQCVGTASGTGTVAVRDTTDRGGAMLSVPAAAWTAFLATLR